MIEFLITAPELPIKSLNDKGEFVRIDNTHEQIKAKIYKDIAQAEFEFSRDLISIFKDFEVKMQSQTAMNLIDTFTQNLNDEDFEAFKDLYQSSSISHSLTSYVPILQRSNTNKLNCAVDRVNFLSFIF